MNEKIQQFLDSDLLEMYLLGDCSEEEKARVERYLALYPEVRSAYESMQENLEEFVRSYAIRPPAGTKERILGEIRRARRGRSALWRYAVAASIAIIFGSVILITLYQQNQELIDQNKQFDGLITDMRSDMNNQLAEMRNRFIIMNNPHTRQVSVKGNRKARELKVVAYANPIKKLSYINVQNLPNLPESQCFQVWTEVNGKLTNLGVLKPLDGEELFKAIPYNEEAVSFITVEPEGGNEWPTLANKVTEIATDRVISSRNYLNK